MARHQKEEHHLSILTESLRTAHTTSCHHSFERGFFAFFAFEVRVLPFAGFFAFDDRAVPRRPVAPFVDFPATMPFFFFFFFLILLAAGSAVVVVGGSAGTGDGPPGSAGRGGGVLCPDCGSGVSPPPPLRHFCRPVIAPNTTAPANSAVAAAGTSPGRPPPTLPRSPRCGTWAEPPAVDLAIVDGCHPGPFTALGFCNPILMRRVVRITAPNEWLRGPGCCCRLVFGGGWTREQASCGRCGAMIAVVHQDLDGLAVLRPHRGLCGGNGCRTIKMLV